MTTSKRKRVIRAWAILNDGIILCDSRLTWGQYRLFRTWGDAMRHTIKNPNIHEEIIEVEIRPILKKGKKR